MVLLQQILSERSQGKSEAAESEQVVPPQRHRLPLWEPLAVLGILAILVEIIFYYQKDYSSVSDREKYCHKCVKKIVNSDKYYANFGGKL